MKKLSKNLVSMLFLLVLLILILIGIYAFGIYHFKTHFYNNSTINGINVGEMTADQARYAIQNQMRKYTLTCKERNNVTDKITGDQIYLTYQDDGTVDKLLDDQDSRFWIFHITLGKKYHIPLGYTYDSGSIEDVMNKMNAFSAPDIQAPENAKIVDNGSDFTVSESVQGNTLNYEKTKAAIINAIENHKTEINFEDLDLYEKPTENESSSDIQEKAADINKLLNINITYNLADKEFTINSSNIRDFLVEDDKEGYTLSKDKLAEWVKNMAYETDTYGLSRKFRTTSGKEIQLEGGGDYGWCIYQEETTNDLYNAILNGDSGQRDPIYLYSALDRGANDIGGTYVEICITKQEMWCYKDGTLIVDTPVITGNHSLGQDTPSGSVYAIDGKESNTTFPEAHNVKISYWLPFVDSCGIHDAYWRTEAQFENKNTYLTNGSNGCINTPKDAAAKIFDVMDVGYPVVVYYSEDQPVGPQPTSADASANVALSNQ